MDETHNNDLSERRMQAEGRGEEVETGDDSDWLQHGEDRLPWEFEDSAEEQSEECEPLEHEEEEACEVADQKAAKAGTKRRRKAPVGLGFWIMAAIVFSRYWRQIASMEKKEIVENLVGGIKVSLTEPLGRVLFGIGVILLAIIFVLLLKNNRE